MKSKFAFLIVLPFIALFAIPAFAVEYEGTFVIHQEGKEYGMEKFSVNFHKDGWIKSNSSTGFSEDDVTHQSLTEIEFRTTGELKSYQREYYTSMVPQKLAAINQGAYLLVRLKSGGKEIEKKLPFGKDYLVMDTAIFHHYYLLLNKYPKGAKGERSYRAVSPSDLKDFKVKIKYVESGSVKVSKGVFLADHYFVNIGDVGSDVWVDERGKIILIDIPMQGFRVELKDYKGRKGNLTLDSAAKSTGILREDISFTSKDSIKISGSVTKPANLQGKLPTIVFASTTGPQDRDGVNVVANIPTHTGDILDYLTRQGFLVLRYDDRGVGKSGDSFARNFLSKQADDLNAAINYLKSRPDVDQKRIALIGHGEGGNVAIRVAGSRNDIKALVALAPSSISLSELMIIQLKKRLTEQGETNPEAYKESPYYRMLEMSRKSDKEFEVIGRRPVYLETFRQWDKLDPVADLKKVKCAVLHVQGGKDSQVFPELASKFKAGAKGKYSFKEFSELDHFFVKSDGTVGSYTDPTRKIDEGFLKYLAAWLSANL